MKEKIIEAIGVFIVTAALVVIFATAVIIILGAALIGLAAGLLGLYLFFIQNEYLIGAICIIISGLILDFICREVF
jgi:hypothetical protein